MQVVCKNTDALCYQQYLIRQATSNSWLNALYINLHQFTFQFLLWQEMHKEGFPFKGFCIAAGIPTTKKVVKIIDSLHRVSIHNVNFKPGSMDSIWQVINIATANPSFPIIMQWTSSCASSHHSCKDFHQLILSTYSTIHQHANLLVDSFSFGGADNLWPYLTSNWSVKQFSVQPMLFDSFLFASHMMVVKEVHTSVLVTDLIIAMVGVGNAQWKGMYTKDTRGILMVQLELSEPIHEVVTQGVKLWKEFDDMVFKLSKKKCMVWLSERRSDVIAKLNHNFLKPWFGWKKGDMVAKGISDMMYEEVLVRMVRLMYVTHKGQWIDLSLQNLTGNWL
jgi:enoyl reductase-like protein